MESGFPPVLFAATYALAGQNLALALGAAMVAAVILAIARLIRGGKPIRVLGGLVAVGVAALVAARTGNAADYFLPSLLANVLSALVWAFSIMARWPLLGVILGFALGQKTGWRQDPDLLSAYGRASWVWAGSFLVRAGVNLPLYLTDNVVGLGISRVVLGWPMVLVVIAMSWWIIKRSLPQDHPGILHPRGRRPS